MQNKLGKKIYSKLLIILLIAAVLLVYQFAVSQPADGREEAALPVFNVVPLQPENVAIQSSYVGYVTPVHSVEVMPYITGYLDKILVRGGDEVKAGQTLIIIRQAEYKARLDAAKAAVLQAQAEYNNADLYYGRVKKAGGQAISKTELDNAKARFLSAQAALAQAKANRDLAQVNYDYTEIKAPIDGVVGNVNLTKGEYVSPASKPLLNIIQTNPIRVVFSITDKDYLNEISKGASSLFSGDKIKLRLANGEVSKKEGAFQFTDNAVDRKTNSIAVFADFENEDRALVANAYVDVLIAKTYENGVLIPQNLVTLGSNANYVYVVNNSELKRIPVEIVNTVGGSYLVKNVFEPKSWLVTDKVGNYRDGQKVKIKTNAVPTKMPEKK